MPVTIEKPFRIQIKKVETKMYFVSILYDKYVSWEFCVYTLMEVFHKDLEQAKAITDVILSDGEAICGIYTFEIADTKATIVEEKANKEDFSLRCLIEEV
ncbi:MAG: ATP-dependent Clp protease adaptor ClpS [Sulfurimonas sp.]|nr:MAG: ATP-dependent Clp protease adaptor ClpS [Sulfurimonas sp.]